MTLPTLALMLAIQLSVLVPYLVLLAEHIRSRSTPGL
jgi:hypothetical protein